MGRPETFSRSVVHVEEAQTRLVPGIGRTGLADDGRRVGPPRKRQGPDPMRERWPPTGRCRYAVSRGLTEVIEVVAAYPMNNAVRVLVGHLGLVLASGRRSNGTPRRATDEPLTGTPAASATPANGQSCGSSAEAHRCVLRAPPTSPRKGTPPAPGRAARSPFPDYPANHWRTVR